MDYYQELLKALGNTDDVEYLFKTQRENKPGYQGSYYAQHRDKKSSGFREPSDQKGTGYKLQEKSSKTFFLSNADADDFNRIFRNKNVGTEMVPLNYDQKTGTGVVALKALEDGSNIWTGPFKKGDIIKKANFTFEPKVGLAPVEILENGHYSPRGSTGGAHFGSPITEVHPRPARLAGKTGIAAALAGGAGAASAGDLRRAAGDVAEAFLPLGLTPSTLAPGTLTPEQRAAQEDAMQRMQAAQGAFPSREAPARVQDRAARAKAQALLRAVPLPEEYRQGGRVRMI